MKISISYPPLSGVNGTPMISQNRQYQVFSAPTNIYLMTQKDLDDENASEPA
jgi:anaerobic magnesium-protoporphyrin IX monomethyl ester cyclase